MEEKEGEEHAKKRNEKLKGAVGGREKVVLLNGRKKYLFVYINKYIKLTLINQLRS